MVELEEEWEETSFHCPECGSALSYKLVKGQNGTVNMAFWCEGAGDARAKKVSLTSFYLEEHMSLMLFHTMHSQLIRIGQTELAYSTLKRRKYCYIMAIFTS